MTEEQLVSSASRFERSFQQFEDGVTVLAPDTDFGTVPTGATFREGRRNLSKGKMWLLSTAEVVKEMRTLDGCQRSEPAVKQSMTG